VNDSLLFLEAWTEGSDSEPDCCLLPLLMDEIAISLCAISASTGSGSGSLLLSLIFLGNCQIC
jgi:hypothetical protein